MYTHWGTNVMCKQYNSMWCCRHTANVFTNKLSAKAMALLTERMVFALNNNQ